jgi:hypothetical protein
MLRLMSLPVVGVVAHLQLQYWCCHHAGGVVLADVVDAEPAVALMCVLLGLCVEQCCALVGAMVAAVLALLVCAHLVELMICVNTVALQNIQNNHQSSQSNHVKNIPMHHSLTHPRDTHGHCVMHLLWLESLDHHLKSVGLLGNMYHQGLYQPWVVSHHSQAELAAPAWMAAMM